MNYTYHIAHAYGMIISELSLRSGHRLHDLSYLDMVVLLAYSIDTAITHIYIHTWVMKHIKVYNLRGKYQMQVQFVCL